MEMDLLDVSHAQQASRHLAVVKSQLHEVEEEGLGNLHTLDLTLGKYDH